MQRTTMPLTIANNAMEEMYGLLGNDLNKKYLMHCRGYYRAQDSGVG